MKRAFSSALFAILFGLLPAAMAEPVEVTREKSAYNGDNAIDPATLLAPENFTETSKLGYVVIEGFINYVAKAWPEDDGDYHFEMQNVAEAYEKNSPSGLVCEIDPVLQLENSEVLRKIKNDDPDTDRKVRVYGWLRFGTQRNHGGVQDYDIDGAGTIVNGHWEIHPVEKIETIDAKEPFTVGPAAEHTKWPIAKRYKVTDDIFDDSKGRMRVSNYAKLMGNVKHIRANPDDSGDLDVDLEVNSDIFVATIPQYYIESFDADTETIKFQRLKNFKLVNYTLKPSDSKIRRFYGLRDWKFKDGKMFPTMAPIEMIK
jgi:hypothetical protein